MTDRSLHEIDELLSHSDSVYRFLLRWLADAHLAEDLTQQTFLQAWSAIRAGVEVQSPKVWLFRIAKNLVLDQFRKRREVHALDLDVTSPHAWDSSKLLSDREDVALAMAAMDRLPTRQRMVMFLVTVEQLGVTEIANLLAGVQGEPPPTPKSSSHVHASQQSIIAVKDHIAVALPSAHPDIEIVQVFSVFDPKD